MILALDASTKSTGYAIFENKNLITSGCIASASADVYKRIHIMRDNLDMILIRYPEIDQIVLEEVLPEQKNQHTFKMLIYLQAAIEFLVWEKYPKLKITYILPNSWRSKCGIQTGRGIKRETLKAADIAFVKNTYGLSVNDDEADAIGIGHSQVCAPQPKPAFDWSQK